MTAVEHEHRAARLERLLGDPFDRTNPVGAEAVLAADERAELLAAGESLLDDFGLNAEFVPESYGGRLRAFEDLIEVMRSVYRRDPCLGLGYGASSLLGAVNVWTAAAEGQCREVADLLLSNKKLSCAYHELAHGNDIGRAEFAAVPENDRVILNGRKEVIANIHRADALVLFARTSEAEGSRSHSQLLVRPGELPRDRFRFLPRYLTTGMRGVPVAGVEFDDCPADANILGKPGRGLEVALTSFQTTRVGLPAMMTGILDTGLRLTLRHLLDRRLYGAAAADMPYLRSVMASAFADLLMCECFTLVAARAVQLLPAEASVHAAAVKSLVSHTLINAMNELSVAMGSRFYVREGEHALFQKLLRDMQPIGFGHAARAVCQLSMLPQLPLMARKSWSSPTSAPEELFRLDAELGPLTFENLRLSGGGRDHLAPALLDPDLFDTAEGSAELRGLIEHFQDELRTLSEVCAKLPPAELTATASSASYDLTERYAATVAASSCIELWRRNDDEFLRDPRWLCAVLRRLARGQRVRDAYLPEHLETFLFEELLERYESGRGFGVRGRPVS